MTDQSSKLGITLATLLACALVWGWPRVFPGTAHGGQAKSPIIAYQNEMRDRLVRQEVPSAVSCPAGVRAPFAPQSYPWQSPPSAWQSTTSSEASSSPARRPENESLVVVIVACDTMETTQSVVAHQVYGEVRARLLANAPSGQRPAVSGCESAPAE